MSGCGDLALWVVLLPIAAFLIGVWWAGRQSDKEEQKLEAEIVGLRNRIFTLEHSSTPEGRIN